MEAQLVDVRRGCRLHEARVNGRLAVASGRPEVAEGSAQTYPDAMHRSRLALLVEAVEAQRHVLGPELPGEPTIRVEGRVEGPHAGDGPRSHAESTAHRRKVLPGGWLLAPGSTVVEPMLPVVPPLAGLLGRSAHHAS